MEKEKSEKMLGLAGIGAIPPGSVVTEDSGPVLYGGVNPIAFTEPILTSKVSGWIGIFGDHYLCQLGCKRFADKNLDRVIKFIEREIRNWNEPKYITKKDKKGIKVKSYLRKPRKKKEPLIPNEEIDKAFDPATNNEQQDSQRKT